MSLFVLPLLVLIGYYCFIRNYEVYQERVRVLNLLMERGQEDIVAGRPWQWRLEAFREITHYQMVFSTKPVKSFYEDAPCTRAL